jgi:hypothetical protein
VTAIIGRSPDCPDCGAQMQGFTVDGRLIWRCPWAKSERRWQAGIVAGVTLVACDWPMKDRNPNGIPPFVEREVEA